MLSEHDYLFGNQKSKGKGIIDTHCNQDFPTLELEQASKKAKFTKNQKQGQAKQ